VRVSLAAGTDDLEIDANVTFGDECEQRERGGVGEVESGRRGPVRGAEQRLAVLAESELDRARIDAQVAPQQRSQRAARATPQSPIAGDRDARCASALGIVERLDDLVADGIQIHTPHVQRPAVEPWIARAGAPRRRLVVVLRRRIGRPVASHRPNIGAPDARSAARAATPGLARQVTSAAVRALPTRLQGLVAIEPVKHGDERGFFCETYRGEWHAELGIDGEERFVQDNHSRSSRAVLRGMHFHIGDGVAKLVRCARGRILDVAVDLRAGSPTYGEWEGVELDEASMRELYVPVGFAHGFCVLSDVADVIYKQTAYYDPAVERGIAWNDPDIAIEWPFPADQLIVSERDAAAPLLRELAGELPFQWHP
jgi:dTDP-4-dehydrorhamnose 3,5-epimerase